MIQFEFSGKMVSGKNQQQIVVIGKRIMKFPNKNFKLWRREFQAQLNTQKPKFGLPLVGPVKLSVLYYPGDRIRRDVTGILDAMFHAFEVKNGGCVVEDDSQFEHVTIQKCELRRENPGVSIAVEAAV